MTVVRRIQPGDAGLLRAVRLRALATDPEAFGSWHDREAALPDSHWRDWARMDSRGADSITLLAFWGPEAVGLVRAVGDDDEPDPYDVFSMWVAPEARGHGLGRRLLDELEAWIRSVGGKVIRLSVTDRAEVAQALYRSAGFEPDGSEWNSRHTEGLIEAGLRKRLA